MAQPSSIASSCLLPSWTVCSPRVRRSSPRLFSPPRPAPCARWRCADRTRRCGLAGLAEAQLRGLYELLISHFGLDLWEQIHTSRCAAPQSALAVRHLSMDGLVAGWHRAGTLRSPRRTPRASARSFALTSQCARRCHEEPQRTIANGRKPWHAATAFLTRSAGCVVCMSTQRHTYAKTKSTLLCVVCMRVSRRCILCIGWQ